MSNVPALRIATNASGMRGVGPQADTFFLGGSACPLFCELIPGSLRVATEYDIRKGYGLSWATVVPAGVSLAVMRFHIHVIGATDDTLWTNWCPILQRPQPQAGQAQFKALGFFHDMCSGPAYGVQAVLVSELIYVGQVESGHNVHEVAFIEWKQPLPSPPKPSQATPATANGPPQAEDALGVAQNAQTAENAATAAQIASYSGETGDAISTGTSLEDPAGLSP
jgi:hypothetical protein